MISNYRRITSGQLRNLWSGRQRGRACSRWCLGVCFVLSSPLSSIVSVHLID